ncbi:hypothetical protein [Rhodococcoides kroppenstedtii]|uniref:hypothetical protein n=1 Tax=Rhodococcoides kroppenstedtii TaxID=293050 RepID=UPI001427BDB2|nr:hypothetical protein [Rhodococcus kroppenstedtii]
MERTSGSPNNHPAAPTFRGIPANEVPRLVPLHLVLARNDKIAVWMTGANVFSTCLTFTVEARTTIAGRLLGMYGFGKPEPSHTPQMLLGVETSDGTWATNLPGRPTGLRPNGGSGSDGQGRVDMILHPVPPSGPLQVYFAWPHFGIDETRHTLDGDLIASAAGDVTTLWPEIDLTQSQIDFNDRTVAEIGVPDGGWFAAALEKQKPPPRDPNAPQRINFAVTSDDPQER